MGSINTIAVLEALVDDLEATLGAVDSAEAAGAVTDTDVAMAYIKQLVTAIIAVQAKTDNLPASPAPTETIALKTYDPGLQDTTDLEGATKNITATAKGGVADYSAALTLPDPDDAEIVVKRIAARLSFTVDSHGAGTDHVYCSVYVDDADGSEADHCLFDSIDSNAPETKLAAQDTLVGTKEVIFDLLKDGGAHTFYFFFWADHSDGAVISAVQLWEGVGTCSTSSFGKAILDIEHSGLASIGYYQTKQGSGNIVARLCRRTGEASAKMLASTMFLGADTDIQDTPIPPFLLAGHCYFQTNGSVATDLNYLESMSVVLRSE